MNRPLTETNPNLETTTYTYHSGGSIASLADARGSTTTFLVDGLSRRTRMNYPGGSFEAWTYDLAGNNTVYLTRAGTTMTCTFDSRDRDVLCDWSDSTPDVTRTFDAAGRQTSATNAAVALTYGYNGSGGSGSGKES